MSSCDSILLPQRLDFSHRQLSCVTSALSTHSVIMLQLYASHRWPRKHSCLQSASSFFSDVNCDISFASLPLLSTDSVMNGFVQVCWAHVNSRQGHENRVRWNLDWKYGSTFLEQQGIMFSQLECSHSANFKLLMSRHQIKSALVSYVFHQRPLPLHHHSMPAAEQFNYVDSQRVCMPAV